MKRYISMFLVALLIVPLLVVPARAGTNDPNIWHPLSSVSFPMTLNGVTLSYDPVEQIYTMNGTGTGTVGNAFTFIINSSYIYDDSGSYVLTYYPVSGSTSGSGTRLALRAQPGGTGGNLLLILSSTSSQASSDVKSVTFGTALYWIHAYGGITYNNLKFKVQFEKAPVSSWKPSGDSESTYNLTVSAGAGGIVSGGTGPYEAGSTVNLSATPNTGYVFNGWSSSSGGSFGNASLASTTFTTPANDTTVTASFRLEDTPPPEKYQLTVSGGTGGTASGSGSYEAGSVVSISAIHDK